MQHLVFFVTEDWYFCSHRLDLAKAAIRQGFRVSVICNIDKHEKVIKSAGIEVIPIKLNRSGLGLLANFKLVFTLYHLFNRVKPDIVHNVAQKPVIFGSLAARLAGVKKIVNALGGLGYVFTSGTIKAKTLKLVMSFLYKRLLGGKKMILILQNKDDLQFFSEKIGLSSEQLTLIRGAGIDVDNFSTQPFPARSKVRITLVARMLKDKGVGEFLKAARLVSCEEDQAEFQLVGDIDKGNPNSYTYDELSELAEQSGVIWHGPSQDIFKVWSESDISVLPSYREGLPKSLLESASVGRPIITTDVPGCREVVVDGVNGFLVPKGDSQQLAAKVLLLVRDKSLREAMGRASRELAVEQFSSSIVIGQTLGLYHS